MGPISAIGQNAACVAIGPRRHRRDHALPQAWALPMQPNQVADAKSATAAWLGRRHAW
jgi:hypothetical protein